ncbi:MAG: FtsX-like permease family protein [Myxococcota bacterium]
MRIRTPHGMQLRTGTVPRRSGRLPLCGLSVQRILTVLALASSAALALSLLRASRPVRQGIDELSTRALGALVPGTELEIIDREGKLEEELAQHIGEIPGVQLAIPLRHERVRILSSARPMEIVGVDLSALRGALDGPSRWGRLEIRDPLRLLGEPPALILEASWSDELGLELGETLTVETRSGERKVRLEGRFHLAEARGARGIALMDLWSLETLVGSGGGVERIAIRLAPGVNRAQVRAAITSRLDARTRLRRTSEQAPVSLPVLQPLRIAAAGVAALGLLVAGLLMHTALAQAAEQHSRELELLSCLGMEPSRLRRLIAHNALGLGAIGTALGTAAALVLTPALLRTLALATGGAATRAPEPSSIGGSDLLAIASIWLLPALLAAWPTARHVGDRARTAELSRPSGTRSASGARAACTLGALALAPIPVAFLPGPAVARLGATLLLGLTACAFAGDTLAFALARWRRSQAAWLPGAHVPLGLSLLAQPALARAPFLAFGSLVCGAALMLCVLESLTSSAEGWIERRHGGGALLVAGSPHPGPLRERIHAETLAAIRRIPGVRDVAAFSNREIRFRGERVLLGALPTEVLRRRGALGSEDTPADEIAAALLRGEIALSHAFRSHFGIEVGESLVLETLRGPHSFRAGALLRDYSGPAGSLHLDVSSFERLFGAQGADFAVLWTTRPTSEIETELHSRLEKQQAVFLRDAHELRRAARSLLRRARSPLAVLGGLGGLLGTLTIVSLVLEGIRARSEELGRIAMLGASRSHLRALVLGDAVGLALLASLLGVALGVLAARPATDAVFEGLGWVVRLALPGPLLLGLIPVTMGLATLAALPASIRLDGVAASAPGASSPAPSGIRDV